MRKVELLSPVGNMQSLYQAVHNGADAVYLGGKKFGARSYAENFDEQEILQAIEYCHLYGVKIYITVNTMIFDDEMEEVLEYVRFLHLHGVDALIVQDLGLLTTLRRVYPNLEIHASTQFHNCNDTQLDFLDSLGVKRAVLARELSLEEIKNLTCPIEKEVFVHGALCVSYSGQCLFSSLNGGRSGNRGECTGCCRLPYELWDEEGQIKTDGNYLLSTKSLCTIEHIGELIEAGITCFKIEGRMKSKEYVGYVTRAYRDAIDCYYEHRPFDAKPYLFGLQKLYFREFTEGYLFGKSGSEVMNIKTSNHIGIPLGKVIEVTKDKIKIKLQEDLNQEDGIRFANGSGMIVNFLYNEKGLLTSSCSKGSIALVDRKVDGDLLGEVRKTQDKKFLEELNEHREKKIPITMECEIRKKERISLRLSDGTNSFRLLGTFPEEAIRIETPKERIIEQLAKVGNTPFSIDKLEVKIDEGLFVPIKDINDLRRKATEKLEQVRREKKILFKENSEFRTSKYYIYPNFELNVAVSNEEQLKVCLEENVASIYVSDFALYEKYQDHSNVFYRTPRVLSKYPNLIGEKILATEVGACKKYARENYVVSDYFLNVANNKTISYLFQLGMKKITLSCELTDSLLESINYRCCPLELVIYGRIELMILKYCPLNLLVQKEKDGCHVCSNGKKYFLQNEKKEKFPIVVKRPLTHILQKEVTDRTSEIPHYKKLGIKCYRIELFDETKEETKKLIERIRKIVENE